MRTTERERGTKEEADGCKRTLPFSDDTHVALYNTQQEPQRVTEREREKERRGREGLPAVCADSIRAKKT
jgi:hypothetical protein